LRRRSSTGTSTDSTTPQQSLVVDAEGGVVLSTTTDEIPRVTRHGHGDRLIKLNVGGKEFQTLRSTLQASPVLSEYVTRAEANNELESSSGAIFIDRDPTYFGIILTFLRNKTDGIAYNSKQSTLSKKLANKMAGKVTSSQVVNSSSLSSSSTSTCVSSTMTKLTLAKHPQYVRIPKIDDKNHGLLEDLFVEAQHYQLSELQYQLCQSSMWVTFMSVINGGRNPFQTLDELFKQLRRTAFALAGGGSIYGFFQAELTWIENLLPPSLRPNPKHHSNPGGMSNEGGGKDHTTGNPEPSFAT
jgi:hypothetical protein